ncbi:hypothetical protein B0A48_16083 [Cryoendolithus antarcticus]|uniref:Uncharacterized protein n=1 Tax=Cryoendolithus antarcticus TaxID=1507870 RepID=A0A1V8SF36_9PEZI|nr:hypothetical protein B0A48_16083 [Cryoendolithus antarcticus]
MADTSQAPSSPLQRRRSIIEPQIQPSVDGGRETRLRSGSSSRDEEGDGDGHEMGAGEEMIGSGGESEEEEGLEDSGGGVKLEKPIERDGYMSEPALVCCPYPRHRLTTTQMNLSRNRTSQPSLWPSTIAPLPTLPHTSDQSALTSAVPSTRRRHKREYVSLADRPQVDPTALDFQFPGRAYMSDDWRMDQELHSRKADEAEQRKRSKS